MIKAIMATALAAGALAFTGCGGNDSYLPEIQHQEIKYASFEEAFTACYPHMQDDVDIQDIQGEGRDICLSMMYMLEDEWQAMAPGMTLEAYAVERMFPLALAEEFSE